MRWSNYDYEKMAKLAIDIYLDYGINSFPVDAYEIADKMGFKISYYSDYTEEKRNAFLKISEDGTNLPIDGDSMHTKNIIINDRIESPARKQATIFHEIKHIVNHDKDESKYNENMADFFARYMRCPTPYLVYKKMENSNLIQVEFGVSTQMAEIAENNVKQRIKKYGYGIFDYELPLLQQILGDDYDESTIEIINNKKNGDDD